MTGKTETWLDRSMMQRCLRLALRAGEAGNTPVGSILAIGDALIVEQEEEVPKGTDIFGHAELVAVRRGCRRLKRKHLPEATLYTTAEPCLMCSFGIREARIGRVVMGLPTPEIGGVSSSYPILTVHEIGRWGSPPIVIWSELADEIERQLYPGD